METYEAPRLFCDEYAADTLIASDTTTTSSGTKFTHDNKKLAATSAQRMKCAKKLS